MPPWTPPLLFTPREFEVCLCQAAALTPSAPLYDQPCAHRWCALLSLTGTHSSPFLQSTKQNTELPIHKHPQEEEPHVADATALLNASFKAFWGLMSNLAKILSRDHTVWIRALWRSLAGLKARKLCKNQSLPSAFSSTMKMRAEIGCVMLNLPAFSLCIKHAADLLERRGWQNADC